MNFNKVIRKVREMCPPDCNLCEAACARKLGPVGPVIQAENVHKAGIFKAITCYQCSQPECMRVCPVDAITSADDGTVRVDKEKCVGCGACVAACKYQNMFTDEKTGIAFKCEMCGGEPACVNACPNKTLEVFDGNALIKHLNDTDFLARGTRACAGCPAELALRFTLRIVGGRDTVVFGCPGCMTTIMIGSGTQASVRLPYVNCLFTNVPSTMTGVYEYYRHKGKKVNLVAFVGDGSVSDVSFQVLSGAAERGERLLVICYDNEGYMNTGIQRSGTTPFGARTKTTPVGDTRHGKIQNSKYLPLIMVSHNIPYVATASPAYQEDYARKLVKALNVENGLAYIHLHTPCPTGWGFQTDTGIKVAQVAVETNYFPLWEYVSGKLEITKDIKKPLPVTEFTRLNNRFSHLNADDIQQLQQMVDERLTRIKMFTDRG